MATFRQRVILAGAGQTGRALARRLAEDWDVIVVDPDDSKREQIPGVTFCTGDATSSLVLQQAIGGEGVAAAVGLTSRDDVNLEFCRLCRVLYKVPRILSTVRQSGDRSAFEELEVVTLSRPDAIVSALQSRLEQGKRTTSEVGLGKGEILEVSVLPNSPVVGKRLQDLSPQSWLVAALYRKGELVVPHGSTRIEEGDTVLLVGEPAILPSIANLFRSGNSEFPLQFGSYVVCRDPDALPEARYLADHTHALGCQESEDEGCVVLRGPAKSWKQLLGLDSKAFLQAVEGARAPVLLARGSNPYDQIVVAVSPGQLREVELAIDVARVLGQSRITAVVVLPPTIVTGTDRVEQLRSALQGAVKLGQLYHVEVAPVALEGNPVSQIVQFARRFRLLVMGHRRHRRHSLTRPDVSRLILSRCSISTLVTCSGS